MTLNELKVQIALGTFTIRTFPPLSYIERISDEQIIHLLCMEYVRLVGPSAISHSELYRSLRNHPLITSEDAEKIYKAHAVMSK